MRIVRNIIGLVLVLVFLMAIGGKSSDAAAFGKNAITAGVATVNVAIDGALQLAAAAAHIGGGSSTTKPKPSPTPPSGLRHG